MLHFARNDGSELTLITLRIAGLLIEGGNRRQKLLLIETLNPSWSDLYPRVVWICP